MNAVNLPLLGVALSSEGLPRRPGACAGQQGAEGVAEEPAEHFRVTPWDANQALALRKYAMVVAFSSGSAPVEASD